MLTSAVRTISRKGIQDSNSYDMLAVEPLNVTFLSFLEAMCIGNCAGIRVCKYGTSINHM